jgi:DNA-binding MarR family transcriptional regulator
MLGDDTRDLMRLYPRIFFACHTRHVQDPATRRLLSAHQASILDHLDEVDSTTVGELARHMGVTPATISVAIDRLERRGYVRRRRDAGDARRVGLTVTPNGASVRQAKSVLDPERVRAMLGHLSEPDRRRALDGLALLAQAAEREMHAKRLYGLRRRPAPREASPLQEGDR